jgi:hypothetical protein
VQISFRLRLVQRGLDLAEFFSNRQQRYFPFAAGNCAQ